VSITKVVGFFTTNPKKLSLHFSEVSTIFYAFYKFQTKVKHYLRNQLSPRSREVSVDSQPYPYFAQNTQKYHRPCNVVPRHQLAAIRPNFGEPAAGTGRARVGNGPRVLGLDSCARFGQRCHRRARMAQPRSGGRWTPCSGETAADASWPATRASSVGACGGDGSLTGCGKARRRQLGHGRPWRRGSGAQGARGGSTHE
jgi:hypothetical protein